MVVVVIITIIIVLVIITIVIIIIVLILIIVLIIIIIIIISGENWSYWNIKEKFKEKFGNYTRKTLDRFTTKDSYTRNITHNTESTAV